MLKGGALQPGDDPLKETYLTYTTSFATYSNYDERNIDAGTISINNLLPWVFTTLNLERPLYYDFLAAKMQVLPGYNSQGIFLHNDGTYSDSLRPEEEEAYRELKLIQYDYIFGEQNGIELFTMP